MAEEYLDILDEQGKPTGQTRTYFDAHKEGLLHRAVHVWIVNSQEQILLQKRSAKMRAFPNCWDISASGHISAGQTSIEGAQMETREEIGISLPPSAFIYLFTLRQYIVLDNDTYVNDEFQDVYIIHLDIEISEIHTDKKEVAELKWISKDEFEKLIKEKNELFSSHQEEYERFLEYLC